MKKLIYIFVIAAVVLASCKKNTTNEPAPVQQQEVEFNIISILPSGERVAGYDIPLL